MELTELCTKLKFEYLPAQLGTLCEQAAKANSITRSS